MHTVRSYIASICTLLLVAPAGAQASDPQAGQNSVEPILNRPHSLPRKLAYPYTPRHVPPPNTHNSPRLDALIRAGSLYLSLQDAIALALENNLDIEVQRYGPPARKAPTRHPQVRYV